MRRAPVNFDGEAHMASAHRQTFDHSGVGNALCDADRAPASA
jgi:hypothetical protein